MSKRLFSFLLLLLVLLCVSGYACAEGNVLTLPANTKTIQAEAFYNDTALEEVVLPEGIQTIGAKALPKAA